MHTTSTHTHTHMHTQSTFVWKFINKRNWSSQLWRPGGQDQGRAPVYEALPVHGSHLRTGCSRSGKARES